MKFSILFIFISCGFAHNHAKPPATSHSLRLKRGAVGALHIVTNHAQPIHADVKQDATNNDNAEKITNEQVLDKPCPKGSGPAHIEPGIGFKVTPPEDTITTYEVKSLRKSLAYTPPSTLMLIRSISRVVTLIVLFVSAVLEFYPTFHGLISTIFNFMNAK